MLECSRRYLRRYRLATTLAILASMAVFAIVLDLGLGVHTLGDEVSVFLLFAIAVAAALAFRYLIPKVVRGKLAFYRQLLPMAHGYARGPRVQVASILNNGLLVRDFYIPRRSSSESGLLFEVFLAADGSALPPDTAWLRGAPEILPPAWSLQELRQKSHPGREEAHELARRLGSRMVDTHVIEIPDGANAVAPQARWRASAWFYDDRWQGKANRVSQLSEEILSLLKDLTAKADAQPLEPS